MKYINAIIGIGLLIASLFLFFNMDTKEDMYIWALVLMSGITFTICFLYEEKKEEAEDLRKIITHAQKTYKW